MNLLFALAISTIGVLACGSVVFIALSWLINSWWDAGGYYDGYSAISVSFLAYVAAQYFMMTFTLEKFDVRRLHWLAALTIVFWLIFLIPSISYSNLVSVAAEVGAIAAVIYVWMEQRRERQSGVRSPNDALKRILIFLGAITFQGILVLGAYAEGGEVAAYVTLAFFLALWIFSSDFREEIFPARKEIVSENCKTFENMWSPLMIDKVAPPDLISRGFELEKVGDYLSALALFSRASEAGSGYAKPHILRLEKKMSEHEIERALYLTDFDLASRLENTSDVRKCE